MNTEVKKLINPGRTYVMYYIAKFCFTILTCMETYYIASYTTDAALIPVVLVFIPLTIPTIVDFIMSFLNGIILEKMPHPLGKYTFWMAIGPIVASICYAIVYIRFDDDKTCAIIMCAMIIIAHFFWNIAEITHTSVPSIMTDEVKQRSTLSMLQSSGSSVATFVFGLVALPIINAVNEKTGTLTQGYFALTVICGVLYIIGYLLLAFTIRGMEKREEELVAAAAARKAAEAHNEKAAKLSGKEMLQSFFGNGPLVALTLMQLFTWLCGFVPMGFTVYFFRCSLGAMAMMSLFVSGRSLAGMFAMFLFPVYQKLFKGNKKRMLLTCNLISIAWYFIFYFLRCNVMAYIVVSILVRLFAGPGAMNTLAFYADAATYAQWKTGADSRAFVMSLYTIPLKLALLIRGVLTSAILVALNYDPGLEPSTYKEPFFFVYVLLSGIFSLIAWLIMLFGYHLSEAKVTQMALEIQQRSTNSST
ncbi:MAG: MFS transporter [Eubacterium sp.]|nr:MFS transporter [Eubacterium sp.]